MADKPETNNDANDYSRFDDVADSDSDDEPPTIPASERLQQMGKAKVEGNGQISKSNYELAAKQYRKGLKIVNDFNKSVPSPNPSETLEAKELELSLYLNLSMAELKLEKYNEAKKSATSALKLDPKNIKALFRRGQSNHKIGNLDEAKNDILLLLNYDKNNLLAKKEYNIIKKKILQSKEISKKGFGGIFEKASGIYDDREAEIALSKKKKLEDDAKLYQEYENDMISKEKEYNLKNNIIENNENDNINNEENNKNKKTTFQKTSYDEWKKNHKKKLDDNEKEKQAQKKLKLDQENNKKKELLKKQQKEKKQDKKENDEIELDEEDLKLVQSIKKKGYCHFRREQTDEEKQLIGNITPQKITSDSSDESSTSTIAPTAAFAPQRIQNNQLNDNSSKSGSVWNTCGTWEETDCSEWGIENMKKSLLLAHVSSGNDDLMSTPETVSKLLDTMDLKTIPNNENSQFSKMEELCSTFAKVSCKIIKIKKVEGDCSIAVVRGTKRYLFDLSAELEYEVLVDESFGMDISADSTDKARQFKYKGNLILNDITHDIDALEISIQPKTKISKSSHIDRINKILDLLKKDISKRCIPLFETDFQAKF